MECSILHLEVSVLNAPMEGAPLCRADVLLRSKNKTVLLHAGVVTRAKRPEIGSELRSGHGREASTIGGTRMFNFILNVTPKNKGASAVKLLRPIKLIRKVFTLPGSTWREDNPRPDGRQLNSRCVPVTICG